MTTADVPLWFECRALFDRESELLDDGQWSEWLTLLAPDMTYEVLAGTHEAVPACFARETAATLAQRIRRLGTKDAWAEDPPSRTLRLVTGVRAHEEADGAIAARSRVLVVRVRDDEPDAVLLAAERRDTLRRADRGLVISARSVRLVDRVLRMPNLALVM